MTTRSVPILILGGALIAGLTACTGPVASPPEAAAPTSPSARPSATTSAAANCPVTTATLLTTIKQEHPDWGGQELSKVRCFQDYAMTTRRAAVKGADSEVETFRYTDGQWRMVVGGSGGYCEGVPADVQKHFRGDGYPGCE